MTLSDVLHELLNCIGTGNDYLVSWKQIQRWPSEAIDIFEKIGWLKRIFPATTIECSGCENNCFMPVQHKPASLEKSSLAFVSCDVDSNMGMVNIPLPLLQQWQLTYMQLAQWFCQELNLRSNPTTDDEKTNIKLGTLKSDLKIAELHLDFNQPISLKISGHALPLSETVYIKSSEVKLDQLTILAMINLPPAKYKDKVINTKMKSAPDNTHEVGSPEWRKSTARNAANTRHSQEGGSHDKQAQIQKIWATGKYTSRDLCAEQECADLNMSFSAARKALRNTPQPHLADTKQRLATA